MLLVAGFLAFVATAVEQTRSMNKMIAHRDANLDALRVRGLLEETMSLLKDLETGQRGFIATGREAYLEPYYDAYARFHKVYERTINGLMFRSEHYDLFLELDALIQARIAHAQRMIERRRQEGPSVLRSIADYDEGKRLMDGIRTIMQFLQDRQDRISADCRRQAREVQAHALRMNLYLAGSGALLILLSMALLIAERRRRDRAERELQAANASLEEGVARRTAELSDALDRIKSFASELDRNIEKERRRIARDVHDQIGQVFTALGMIVFDPAAPRTRLSPAPGAAGETRKMLDEGVRVARRISNELRPALLDDFGLAAAIEYYAESAVGPGGPALRTEIADDDALSPEQANQLFRIMQEALTNVLRHAQAGEVHIGGLRADGGYRFVIADNGKGPGPVRADAGGIRNMRERAILAGGELEITRNAQGGTSVTVRLANLEREEVL